METGGPCDAASSRAATPQTFVFTAVGQKTSSAPLLRLIGQTSAVLYAPRLHQCADGRQASLADGSLRPSGSAQISIYAAAAIFRRRFQAINPPTAKISPGIPAPTIGPGTAAGAENCVTSPYSSTPPVTPLSE